MKSVRGYKEAERKPEKRLSTLSERTKSTESQHEHLVGKQRDDRAGNRGSGRSGFFCFVGISITLKISVPKACYNVYLWLVKLNRHACRFYYVFIFSF